MSPEVKHQNEQIWNDLDDDEDGQINLPQLYSFLTRQGLNIEREDECQVMKWLMFDVILNIDIEDVLLRPIEWSAMNEYVMSNEWICECDQQWFETFDIDKNGGIDQTEFMVVISIAKQLTMEPLDQSSALVKHHRPFFILYIIFPIIVLGSSDFEISSRSNCYWGC